MGHRFSKSTSTSFTKQQEQQQKSTILKIKESNENIQSFSSTTENSAPKTVATISNSNLINNNNQQSARFIIKIQLTKMESPEDDNCNSADKNCTNNSTKKPQVLSVSFLKNIPVNNAVQQNSEGATEHDDKRMDDNLLNNLNLVHLNNNNSRNAGIPIIANNISSDKNILKDGNHNLTCDSTNRNRDQNFENNLNLTMKNFDNCDIAQNQLLNQNIKYHDLPEMSSSYSKHQDNSRGKHSCSRNNSSSSSPMCSNNPNDNKSHCCRRKSSSSSSSAYPSKWRCCKCACRDAVKKIVNSSPNSSVTSSCNNVSTDVTESSSMIPVKSSSSWTSRFSCNNNKKDKQQLTSVIESAENPCNLVNQSGANTKSFSTESTIPTTAATATTVATIVPVVTSTLTNQTTATNHVAIWSPNEVVLPITARPGEILVLQCPQPLVYRIEDTDERARRLRAIEIENGVDTLSSAELDSALSAVPWHPIFRSPSSGLTISAPIVHSRVDYLHCLVPDLEKITNSSFYWGKMDRYEAERLLEGKPEGTFLLRDSAQEEYLFSVTFRKYERSLHARIEQFNRKFSFDCHDPGVFTSPTVTGLLEHYKDPSCVMFFEPMLTIPLNRNFTFSLQQLCRAKIVSNISYDGINELQLPTSLKGYLKEYHYKLRVNYKPFDESFYSFS